MNRLLLEFPFQLWRWICREREGMGLAAPAECLGVPSTSWVLLLYSANT